MLAGTDRRRPSPSATELLQDGLDAMLPPLRVARTWAYRRKRSRYAKAIALYVRLSCASREDRRPL